MKNPVELRSANEAELRKQLDDLYHELFNLRFQRTAGQMPNTSRLKVVRRDIARVRTIMREHELAVARGRGGA
jgi:large subunit ribosomal protein L29